MPAVAEIGVREAVLADLPQIAAVALAAGQDEDWGGAGAAYMMHLLAHGRVVVGVCDDSVVGFGATRAIGRGPGAVSMLCDLFVDPRLHGSGCGRVMLAELWPGRGRRMTFSSLHGHPLPLYTSFGLDAWWPLLYLRGWPACTRRTGRRSSACRGRTRPSGRCSPRAGGWRSSTCTWRPSRGCLTRAGRCRLRRWPERRREPDRALAGRVSPSSA
jgi:GNAT superfamily N-acetyltransferase